MESKKTKYKNVEMKSMLEARTAAVLDNLGMYWQYEVDNFVLEEGQSFIPDFKIHEKLYLECKGEIDSAQRLFHLKVATQLKIDILLVSYKKVYFYCGTQYDIKEETEFQCLNCSDCKRVSFITAINHFFCTNCKAHHGDHDVVEYFDLHDKGIKGFYNMLSMEYYKP